MLENDKSKKRVERHKITQEDFTPECIVEDMLNRLPQETFSDISKTIIDYSCGIGNFLVEVLNRKLVYCKDIADVEIALRSIYGVELMADNVEECRERLYKAVIDKFPSIQGDSKINYKIRSIIKCRIQWCDSLKFDYDKWPRIRSMGGRDLNVSFKEMRGEEDTKYPMWFKEPKKQIIELLLFTDKDFE